MSTLAEIEAAVPALTLHELKQLERYLHNVTRERANHAGSFTAREAIAWWRETEHLGAAEAGAFAADIATARAQIQPPVSRWD